MPNKKKEILPNNLLKIREQFGLTQSEMGEILKVTERTICNYETEAGNLPLESAVLLSNKFNLSLDWIYCNYCNEEKKLEDCMELNEFKVDIREFIFFSDDMLHINIADNYWKYIRGINNIYSSDKTNDEKKREKASLDASFHSSNSNNIYWRLSIPSEKILSYIKINSKHILYAMDDDSNIGEEPTPEQRKEMEEFLKNLDK